MNFLLVTAVKHLIKNNEIQIKDMKEKTKKTKLVFHLVFYGLFYYLHCRLESYNSLLFQFLHQRSFDFISALFSSTRYCFVE
jgi:hypothetical protein